MDKLDDLVALLLQKQHPFEEEQFRQAIALCRATSPIKGAALRQRVNLSACLYLEVLNERLTQPRVNELGGWGSRNDVLADIAAFHNGRRPATNSNMASALPLILPGSASGIGDALQIATQQGLEAARKMIETSVRADFEKRLVAASEDFSRRQKTCEEMVVQAARRQEAAEAQRLLVERKLDEALQTNIALSESAATHKASCEAAMIQLDAIKQTVVRERAALDAASVELIDLKTRLATTTDQVERERKQQLLHLDAARVAQVSSDKWRSQADASREKAAQLEVQLAQANARLETLEAEKSELKKRLNDNAELADAQIAIKDAIIKVETTQNALLASFQEASSVVSVEIAQTIERAKDHLDAKFQEQKIAFENVVADKIDNIKKTRESKKQES